MSDTNNEELIAEAEAIARYELREQEFDTPEGREFTPGEIAATLTGLVAALSFRPPVPAEHGDAGTEFMGMTDCVCGKGSWMSTIKRCTKDDSPAPVTPQVTSDPEPSDIDLDQIESEAIVDHWGGDAIALANARQQDIDRVGRRAIWRAALASRPSVEGEREALALAEYRAKIQDEEEAIQKIWGTPMMRSDLLSAAFFYHPEGNETVSAKPEVVTLCGSTRFYDTFQEANYDLTMQGKIVLSVGFYPHSKAEHGHGEGVGHDSVEKVALDELHKRKIDLSDRVLVLNVGGYIGDSTRGEIAYAESIGVPVDYLEAGPVSTTGREQ